MAKYTITYEVEALTLNDATSSAYDVMHLSGLMAHKVEVHPVEDDANKDRTFADVPTESSSPVFERVQREWKAAHPWNKRISEFTD